MAYDGKIMRRARERFEADKARRAAALEQKRQKIYTCLPRVEEIDSDLRTTLSRIIASAMRRGIDPGPAIRALREENLALQRERAAHLMASGYPADYLDEKPNCALCGDSGHKENGELCRCLLEYYTREQNRELSRLLDLGGQSFDTFSFDYYDETPWPDQGVSPRKNMEIIYEICASYAHNFSPNSDNLLFYGGSGLGKTFLSACIAGEVSEKGYSVVYDTAASIFAAFEDKKFNRDSDSGDTDRIMKCDLLIMDDLGTEMTTGFVQSALYQIVNTRIMKNKATIISTNLTPDEIGRRYARQIQSRLEGEYEVLPFFGEDIRKLKKR